MTPTLRKLAAAAALLMTAGLAQAFEAVPDPLTLASTGGSTPLLGTATAMLTLQVNDPVYLLDSGHLRLDFDPTALAFLPLASSVGGVSFASLAALLAPGSVFSVAAGHVEIGGSLTTLTDIGASALPLQLAFQGLRVGAQTVSYTLSLTNDVPDTTSFSNSFGVQVTAVPEPAGWALLLAGLAGIGLMARRRGVAG